MDANILMKFESGQSKGSRILMIALETPRKEVPT